MRINKKCRNLIYITLIGVTVVTSLLLKNNNLKSIYDINIEKEIIDSKKVNFKTLAMYKNDGEGDIPITTMPESEYTINIEKSYCTTDNINKVYNKMYTDESGQHIITGLNKDDKCYLYFDKTVTAEDTILSNSKLNNGTPDFNKTTCSEGCDNSNSGLYKASDDDGTSYYFRGSVENNYVKFADKYWRIIRINGNGSIRLIYQGTSTISTGTDAQIGTSAFNINYNSNMYAGFKYTSGQVHGRDTESTILQKLNIWYNNNLASYTDKIDINAGFCGDRTPSTSPNIINNSGGTGTTSTYYGGYIRLVNSSKAPTLECSTEDFYTISRAIKGNKSLENSIGLITADEVAMSGGVYGKANQSYYLYAGQSYWTMTPYYFNGTVICLFYVDENRIFNMSRADGMGYGLIGIRPVINLKADTKLTGTGTMSDPYIVE